jgi:DNA-binding MarR family transcriptional regulator
MTSAARDLMTLYPQIYFACHTRHVRDAETDTTLSKHQADILNHLDDVEPTNLTDLAEHMGVTVSTMSLATKRLLLQGFITRHRDPSDGRVIQLRLSEAGIRVKERQSVLDGGRVQAVLDRLTAEERFAAIEGLRLLARASAEAMREYSQTRGAGDRRLAGAPSQPQRSGPEAARPGRRGAG